MPALGRCRGLRGPLRSGVARGRGGLGDEAGCRTPARSSCVSSPRPFSLPPPPAEGEPPAGQQPLAAAALAFRAPPRPGTRGELGRGRARQLRPAARGLGAAGLPGARRGFGGVLIYLFVSLLFFVNFFFFFLPPPATPPGLNRGLAVNSNRGARRMGRGRGRRRRPGGRAGAGAPLRSPSEQHPRGRQVPAGRRPREQ